VRYEQHTPFQPAQTKGVNKLYEVGPDGFNNGNIREKYVNHCRVSRATSYRKLTALCEMGCWFRRGRGAVLVGAAWRTTHSLGLERARLSKYSELNDLPPINLYWAKLNVDFSMLSIRCPAVFSLVSGVASQAVVHHEQAVSLGRSSLWGVRHVLKFILYLKHKKTMAAVISPWER
jgi:hypothetical protein